jgi:riboflavin synthase alpha subunit
LSFSSTRPHAGLVFHTALLLLPTVGHGSSITVISVCLVVTCCSRTYFNFFLGCC